MKVNHEQTRNKIFDIAGLLREQARYAKNYKQNVINLTSDETYAEKYKSDKLEELRVAYVKKYNDTKDRVVQLLEDITALELENEKVLEFDIPEFANTISIIDAAQGQLPADVMEGIKVNFAGYYQVLKSIESAFKRYGIEAKDFGYEEYTQSVNFAIQPLISSAQNIEMDETSTIVSLHKLFTDLIHFGEVRGIEFSEEEKTFGEGIDEDINDSITRQAMGLV